MFRTFLAAAAIVALTATAAPAATLIEPQLHLPVDKSAQPRVALTFDACSGDIDHRILDVLLQHNIPATIFVTERWLLRNAPTVALLQSRPDLFDIEDHGRNHIPAVTGTEAPYGIKPAGTLDAVAAEVTGGAAAVTRAFGNTPTWFRGATALYTEDALQKIAALGFRVAGFSLNADFGASVGADVAAQRLGAAKDGDVVIAHINQPKRHAGAGIARGLLALKAKGFTFMRLSEIAPD